MIEDNKQVKEEELSDEERVLDELEKEHNIIEISSFNDFDIKEKLEKNSFYLVRYTELLEKERMNLSKIQDIFEQVRGKRYEHYRFNYDERLDKKEIEMYFLPRDKMIIEVKKHLRLQELRVKFFELCVKAIEKQPWNIKSWLERNKNL